MALSEQLILETQAAFRQLDALQGRLDRLSDVSIDVSANTTGLDADLARTEGLARDTAAAFGDINQQVHLTTDEYKQVVAQIEKGVDPAHAIAVATGSVATEARQAEDAYKRVAAALGISEDEARRLSTELSDSTREASELDADLRQVARSMGLSEQEARQFAAAARQGAIATGEARTAAVGLGNTMATVKGAILGAVAAFGVRGIVGGFNDAAQAAAEFTDSVNAVNVVFGESGDAVLKFAEGASATAGLSATAAQQLVTPIGALLRNFGFEAEEAGDAAVTLTQRAGDLASVFGGEVPEALAAIGAALRGESDPIERFGASINAARVEAFALANGMAETKAEITDAIRVQARYGLILADTARVQGDFVATSGDAANRLRTLKADLANAAVAIGNELMPAFEAFLAKAPELIQQLVDMGPALGDLASGVLDTVVPLLELVGVLGSVVGLVGDFRAASTDLADDENPFSQIAGELGKITTQGAITNLVDMIDKIGSAIEGVNPIILSRTLGELADGLAKNRDPLILLNEGFRDLTTGSSLTVEVLDALIDVVGVADEDLSAFLVRTIRNADALKLTAEEVAVLRNELVSLQGFTRRRPGGSANTLAEPFEQGLAAAEAYRAGIDALGSPLDQLKVLSDETGFSIGFIAQNAALFGSNVASLVTQAGGAALATQELAAGFAAIADAILFDTSDAVEEFDLLINKVNQAGDEVPLTVAEMITELHTQAANFAELEAGTTILEALGFEALAAEIRSKGPAAIGAMRGFLADLGAAQQAEDILDDGAAVGEEYIQGIRDAVANGDVTPELLALIGQFTSTDLQTEVLNAALATGNLFGSELQRVLDALKITLPAEFISVNTSGFQAPPGFVPAAPTGGGGGAPTINFFTEPVPTTDTVRITQTLTQVRNARQ